MLEGDARRLAGERSRRLRNVWCQHRAQGPDFVVSFAGADGSVRWAQQLDPSGASVHDPLKVAAAPGGSTFVVDQAQLYLLDPTGAVTWQKPLSLLGGVNDMRADPAGNVVVVGTFDSGIRGGVDACSTFVVGLTPDGGPRYSATIGGSDLVTHARVALGASMGSFSVETSGGADICLARLDPSGSPLGITAYGTSGDDTLAGTATAPDGHVIVVGHTSGADQGFQLRVIP